MQRYCLPLIGLVVGVVAGADDHSHHHGHSAHSKHALNTAAMHLAAGSGVNEAAYQVGYASPSQFSREFKRQFGKAPREWEQDVNVT